MASDKDGGRAVAAWCQRRLGAGPTEVLFRGGYLSTVVGLRLTDGRAIVVKARSPLTRVYGCVAVQQTLAQAGFPCPRPLAGPELVDGRLLTAEQFLPGGEQLGDGVDSAKLFAGLLAELIALAPPVASVPSLAPSPPWVGWDRDEPKLWPEADDRDQDLNQHPGPDWLDQLAARVRARLADLTLSLVVGHGDWESQNLRWRDRRPWAVHDWDSVVTQTEAAIAGQAAAVWPAAGAPGEAATVEQTEQFLAAYEQARGQPWTRVEWEVGGRPGSGCAPSTPRRTPLSGVGRSWTGWPAEEGMLTGRWGRAAHEFTREVMDKYGDLGDMAGPLEIDAVSITPL